VKLADRLHNMRTVWALKPEKAKALADETLQVRQPPSRAARRPRSWVFRPAALINLSGVGVMQPGRRLKLRGCIIHVGLTRRGRAGRV